MPKTITWAQVQQNNPTNIDIQLSAADCDALARDIGIIALQNYTVQLRFTAQNDGSLLVRGALHAVVVQACVATDAPVTTTLQHTINIRYVPEQRLQQLQKRDGGDNAIIIDSQTEEDCEPLPVHGIAPSALAREELILALPAYPRCAD
jgi:uncharacterized metal-binding protein YceD (DUF177 family)